MLYFVFHGIYRPVALWLRIIHYNMYKLNGSIENIHLLCMHDNTHANTLYWWMQVDEGKKCTKTLTNTFTHRSLHTHLLLYTHWHKFTHTTHIDTVPQNTCCHVQVLCYTYKVKAKFPIPSGELYLSCWDSEGIF